MGKEKWLNNKNFLMNNKHLRKLVQDIDCYANIISSFYTVVWHCQCNCELLQNYLAKLLTRFIFK